MAKPDPLDVRAYNVALKRHRDGAVREAADLERTVRRILDDLRRGGRSTTSDGRSALHTAGMLMEKLVALETLQQDAEHFTVET
ncbi:hypothetical protein [Actinomadura decatromicini]|uniref:Uncharacterized protein n=1 Tax=Actinomadura decatromicini TaxID=2604572 RepID=A0A5D3FB11_9ACTN|nr:hypothetical protein [Actinomadura decatromicini]TYK45094.1 hypothetical protein FXF68_30905 [Actinomadura decatromicini]